MSQAISLQEYLRGQFREAFGQPHHTMGHDDHWKLQSSTVLAINVLVNGSPEKPAVWIFDTHTRDNGVFSRTIATNEQVDDVIALIRKRMKDAG